MACLLVPCFCLKNFDMFRCTLISLLHFTHNSNASRLANLDFEKKIQGKGSKIYLITLLEKQRTKDQVLMKMMVRRTGSSTQCFQESV